MLLLYLSTSLYQILTVKATYFIHNMTYDAYGLKNSSLGTLFSKKLKMCDFSIFVMSRTANFFNMAINIKDDELFAKIFRK